MTNFGKTIKLWVLESGNCIKIFDDHSYVVLCVINVFDDKLISGYGNGLIRKCDLNSVRCVKILKGLTQGLYQALNFY